MSKLTLLDKRRALRATGALALSILCACGGGSNSDITSNSSAATTGSASIPLAATPPMPTSATPVVTPVGARWSDPATWGGALPKAGDKITVPAGQTVVLDIQTPALAGLLIKGTLVADPTQDVGITSDWVIVYGASAKLQIGTPKQPFTRNAVITLTGKDPQENVLALGLGNKVLGVANGGALELFGEAGRTPWTRLATTVSSGARTIQVVNAAGWRVGDNIVLASTTFRADQVSERSITAISGNTLTLNKPLAVEHLCVSNMVAAVRFDQCAEVGLLTRNVVIRGDDASVASNIGAHVMIMDGTAHVNGVELTRVGQLGIKGRYGFHWHLTGNGTGQYLVNSSVHHAFHKGVVIHGTDNVSLSTNVVYSTLGHNIIWAENGVEKNNVLDGNLALLANPVPAAKRLDGASDDLPSNYWGRSPTNVLRNNVAGGANGGSGFWYDLNDHGGRPNGNFANCADCLSTAGQTFGTNYGNPTDPRNQLPMGEFKNNVAHSSNRPDSGRGGDRDFLGGIGLFVETYNPEVESKIARFEGLSAHWNVMGAWVDASYAAFVPRVPYFSVQTIGARIADNATGIHSTGGLVRDSVIVGLLSKAAVESVSLNYRPRMVGLDWFHYPASYQNVVFANFKPFSYGGQNVPSGVVGIAETEGATLWAVTMTAVRLVNSNVSAMKDHYLGDVETNVRSLAIENPDGSLFQSGRPEGLAFKNPLLNTPDCVPAGELMRCPSAPRYLPMTLGYSNAIDYGPIRLTRISDGYSNLMKNFGAGPWNAMGTVLANTTYRVDMSQPLSKISLSLGDGSPHDLARSLWVAYAFAFNGTRVVIYPESGNVILFSSLNDFNASAAQGYFLDSATKRLYLRAYNNMKVCDGAC